MQPRREVAFRTETTTAPDRGRVAVSLGREAELFGEFCPLTPPRELSVTVISPIANAVDHLEVELELDLAGGEHRLPIFPRADLVLAVEPGTRASCLLRALRPEPPAAPDGASRPEATAVSTLELTFSTPVVVRDLLPVLAELPALFEDRDLAQLLALLARATRAAIAGAGVGLRLRGELAAAALRRLADAAAALRPLASRPELAVLLDEVAPLLASLGSTAGELARVSLDRVTARPVRGRHGLRLEPRFSGRVLLLDRVEIPFEDVELPHVILPALHGELPRLLSSAPLATADLRADRVPLEALADALARTVTSFRGRLEADGGLPELDLDVLLHDRGLLEARTSAPAALEAHARFRGRLERDAAELTLDELVLGGGAARARASAELRLRAAPATAGLAEATASAAGGDGSAAGADRGGGVAAGTDRGGGVAAGADRGGGVAAGADPAGGAPVGRRGAARGLAARLARAARDRRLPDGVSLEAAARLEPGSRLPPLDVHATIRHAVLRGGIDLGAAVRELAATGDVVLTGALQGGRAHLRHDAGGALSCHLALREGSWLDDGQHRVDLAGTAAQLEARVRSDDRSFVRVDAAGRADLCVALARDVEAFPELGIDDGELRLELRGRADFDARTTVRRVGERLVEIDYSGSGARTELERAVATLGGRGLSLPAGSSIDLRVREGFLSASGLGRASVDLRWDLCGESPILRHGDRAVEILVPSLRRRELRIDLSPAGGLSVTGQHGDLYDARFWNALLNPGADVDRLGALLDNDESMEKVSAVIELFSPEAHALAERLRALARRVRDVLDDEGIRRPGDAIPRRAIARVLSRVLVGSTELEDRIAELVRRVTDGEGLDVPATKRLLDEALGDHVYGFELDRALRWAAILLSPADPLPPFEPLELPPLEELPEHAARLARVPSARAIYATVGGSGPLPAGFAHRLARVAPWLTLEQLEWILDPARGRTDWPADERIRLTHVRELKRRARMIAESYGGPAFIPQAIAIASFLGETLALGEAWARRGGRDDGLPLPDTIFGPEDVAILLQAGLASVFPGRTEQLNQRMLLDHVLAGPPDYARAVLVELSGRSAHVLAGVLNALLNLEQDCVRRPLDLVTELGTRLGLDLPRLADYLAGGRWARHSYFEALAEAAERILSGAEPHLALKCHLQLDRRPASAGYQPTPASAALEEAARAALGEADALAAPAASADAASDAALRERARAAYDRAFDASARLLAAAPEAIERPWLKGFWGRTHEALVVLSVVREVQGDVDDSRRWLAARAGRPAPDDEQALVDLVIEVLYHDAADRAALRVDPLVRLLLDPPDGAYDFTVVSAMGVITEGARGRELEETYRRLEERRGVRVVRADTTTMRSLEENAVRIEEALRGVEGPWGYVGYSQGCANGLQLEHRLLGGTPDQQARARALRCRNLLFSAYNGSAHGTCSNGKYLRLVVEGERVLKHYQAVFSRPAIQLAQRALRLFLDSRPFVLGMLGSHTLSHEGVRFLQREGQFRPGVPTSTVRGIVEPETLPEALEWMANLLTRQIESPAHDTQVAAHEAVGYPVWVRNAGAAALERAAMGDRIQRTHHWSPLVHETAFVTTARDRERAIYDGPKDRHVLPWIEVNARFGLIPRRAWGTVPA